MNERIKELAIQVIGDYSYGDYWPFYEEELEKFAESIIQECINCKTPLIKYYIDTQSEQDQALLLASISDYVSEIQKHFGIDPTIDDQLRSRSTYFGNNP